MRIASCPRCGADVSHDVKQCAYCGAPFAAPTGLSTGMSERASAAHGASTGPVAFAVSAAAARPDAGEFGFGTAYLGTMLGLASAVFAAGYMLEDKQYWLATIAVAVWAGALPFVLLLGAVFWRARWGGVLPGFAFALAQLALHTVLMWFARRHLQDDHVGIAAMFAGGSLGGFLVGRAIHEMMRRMRARAGL